jgi:hypothetical protein
LIGALGEKSQVPDGGNRPLPLAIIRSTHRRNLDALATAMPGTRNATLNTTCYWAGRAAAAHALEGTDQDIKKQLNDAACKAWGGRMPGADANTARTAWEQGYKTPLAVANDEAAQTLDEFNERFFVVGNYGNQCIVGSLEEENRTAKLPRRFKLCPQRFQDFKNRFDNVKIEIGLKDDGTPVTRGRGSYWLDHPARRYYEKIVFQPEGKEPPDCLNLWRGFAVEPRRGSCEKYLAHIRDVVCQGSDVQFEWYMAQLAWWVQHPGSQGHVSIVHRSGQGTGKNTAADIYGWLWGSHYWSVVKTDQLTGRFNRQLLDCCVCHANEAFYAGAKGHAAALKSLITDPVLQIESKGVDLIQVPNRVKLIISSNETWVVPAGLDERRFAFFDLSEARKQDEKYFNELWDEAEHGGYEALLYYLLNLDVSKHNPMRAQKTSGLVSQKALSLEGADRLWYECLVLGELPGQLDGKGGVLVKTTALLAWATRHKGWRFQSSAEEVGRVLGDHKSQNGAPGMGFARSRTPRRWMVPPLVEARAAWDKARFPGPWTDELENPFWSEDTWEATDLDEPQF